MHRHSLTWTAMFGVIALMFLKLPPMAARQDSVLNTYSALVEVDALAKQQYVERVADDRLVEGAIRGMMKGLDPYSGYISPAELPGFQRRSRGRFYGVGIEIGVRDGVLTVISPIEGSPAARAGMLPGDQLLAVDGEDLHQRSVFDVEEMLTGPPGESVRLRIRRPGDHRSRELTLAREPISLRTVGGVRRDEDGHWDYVLDETAGIGYIRVSSFRENTCTDFDEAVGKLRHRKLGGLILDFRNNPGGFLHQGVAMADRFLQEGVIISTVNRHGAIDEYRAVADATDLDIPLAILMNGGSASASEIVAGALQARGRAIVVGERSFGKGSVQHLLHLVGQKAAIKLTVAYYRLPNGRIIHRTQDGVGLAGSDDWGVKPDVEVIFAPEESQSLQEARRQLELPPAADGAPGSPPSTTTSLYAGEDRQLQAALTALKSQLGAID